MSYNERYNELWKMIKSGKAILPDGTVSQKLSDLKKADMEVRLMASRCGNAPTCGDCQNKNLCWA